MKSVGELQGSFTHTHTYKPTHTMRCVCLCDCVCVLSLSDPACPLSIISIFFSLIAVMVLCTASLGLCSIIHKHHTVLLLILFPSLILLSFHSFEVLDSRIFPLKCSYMSADQPERQRQAWVNYLSFRADGCRWYVNVCVCSCVCVCVCVIVNMATYMFVFSEKYSHTSNVRMKMFLYIYLK